MTLQERAAQVDHFLNYLRGELMEAAHFKVNYARPDIVVGHDAAGRPVETQGGGPVGVLTLVLLSDLEAPPAPPPLPQPSYRWW